MGYCKIVKENKEIVYNTRTKVIATYGSEVWPKKDGADKLLTGLLKWKFIRRWFGHGQRKENCGKAEEML